MSAVQYLILACDDAARCKALAAEIIGRTQLDACQVGDRVLLFIDKRNKPLFFGNRAGVIVGDLFDRSGASSRLTELAESVIAPGIQDYPSILSRRFWGSYVTCYVAPSSITVSRDPSGTLPCYYTHLPGALAFASDVRMMLAMLNKAVTVNWQGVTRSLYTKNLPSTATDLTDVSELLPGTAIIKCGSTWRTEAFWSPWDHVPSRSVDDYDYHAGRLHDTVVRCVSSLAEPYGSVLVGASGGLDSSIIAAGLVRSNVNLSCLTMTTDDPIGDERGYAHAVCQSLGVQLLASPYSMDDVDLSRSSVAHLPRACGRSEVCAYDAAIYRTLASGEFDAFFSGNGGDNVFFLSRSARALADAWISNGATGGALRTATEISAMTGVSVWKVFREATRFVRSVNRRYRWQPQTKFLHPDIVAQQDADPIRHPWLDAPAGALPGKAAHIALLLRLQPYVACFDRSYGIPTINPLAAQPVIEACLGVPTWLMCRGGHDRSVARAAFSSVLPAEIAWRRSKGGPDGFAIDLLRRSLPVVRERLLTGHLANAGILDLEMLDRSLSDASLSRDWDYPRLLSLLDTDAWIENWTRRPH